MSRNVADLIGILMNIEENFSKVYRNIGTIDGSYSIKVKTAANILASQEMMHADSYRELLGKSEIIDLECNDEIYEIVRELLADFKKKVRIEQMPNITKLVEYAIYFEKENAKVLQLILDSVKEENFEFINLLKELINIEKEHTRTLKSFVE